MDELINAPEGGGLKPYEVLFATPTKVADCDAIASALFMERIFNSSMRLSTLRAAS